MPSEVIDRGSRTERAPTDAFARARVRVEELVARYVAPEIDESVLRKWEEIMARECSRAGVAALSA